MIVLGLEASCDDSSVAVVDARRPQGDRILAMTTWHQEEHKATGGVVPEVAARSHMVHLPGLVRQTMVAARVSWGDLAGVAATTGPGLAGGLVAGSVIARTIAMIHDLPWVGVNHLEGHLLAVRLVHPVAFPFLALLASGGHTQCVLCRGLGDYAVLGQTRDDALGECFDKVAVMMGLGWPGGPALEACARTGQPGRFALPQPLRGEPGCDFSFSGLKTAVRNQVQRIDLGSGADNQARADLAASFQSVVARILLDRLDHAYEQAAELCGRQNLRGFVFTGGVSANVFLRGQLEQWGACRGLDSVAPPLPLCTDNGAMIAWAGAERLMKGHTSSLDMPLRPRWPLDERVLQGDGSGRGI
jgi:N6-L-threonylcarbamoyladenine synthase